MLNRRDFHKALGSIALMAMAGPVRAATTDAARGDIVFLNRLSHGATPQGIAELTKLGRAGWLDQQLAMPATDPEISKRLADARLWIDYEAGKAEDGTPWPEMAEHRPLENLDKSPEELVRLLDWEAALEFSERARPADEVIAASFIRATHAPAQLREVMTQFWHDHFSVNATKDETTAALFPPYDALLREHSLGNFRAMLGGVARSPSMLHYLNNDNSQASPANENYARELLELHTLGQENYFNDLYENWHDVPGAAYGESQGYLDADVYEVARAFSGWSIGDGREAGDGAVTPMDGRVAFVAAWHDPYQKRVLGHELPAFSTAETDGDAVLDILAAHPGTARFVSAKMLRRLGIEDPSQGYLDAVVQVFHAGVEAPDQIAQTIRTIVEHPEFMVTKPLKLRRPFEFVSALYRATGAQISPRTGDMDWRLQTAGWTQHQVHPPTGHSDKTVDWADTRTIIGMIDLSRSSHDEWAEITDNILAQVPDGAKSMGDLADHWADRFMVPTENFDLALTALDSGRDEPIPEDAGDVEWANQILVTSAALGAEFLYR